MSLNSHVPMEAIIRQMDLWYRTPLGACLLATEYATLTPYLQDNFGGRLLQIGGPSEVSLFHQSRIFYSVRLSLEHTPVFIPIQLEDAGFLSSSSNTKPGGFLRGKSLFSPLNSRGYTAHHSNTSRTFLRDNALTETSVLKGERYKGFNVRGSFAALPFLPESMDVVLLPHVLEFASDPQAILAQSYIVLAPEGRLIILGFNPWSLWGLSRYGLHRKAFPWQSRFLSAFCVKKWLIQQEFIVEETHSLFFRPPVESKESLQRAMALEALGPLLWANNGGVYLIVARKRVTPFTPITESFGYAGSL